MSDLDVGRIRKPDASPSASGDPNSKKIDLHGPWPEPIAIRLGSVLQVGRQPSNEVVLQGGTVSRTHAAIVWEAKRERPTIEDLGSANGTSVNGVKVQAGHPMVLEHGAVTEVGGHRLGVGRPAPPPAATTSRAEPTDTTKVRRRDMTSSEALAARATDRLPRQDPKKTSGTTDIGYVSFSMRREREKDKSGEG